MTPGSRAQGLWGVQLSRPWLRATPEEMIVTACVQLLTTGEEKPPPAKNMMIVVSSNATRPQTAAPPATKALKPTFRTH